MNKIHKIIFVLMLLIIMILLSTTIVNAEGLTLKTTADKKEAIIGEQLVVTIDWEKGMQAASIFLNYDKDKVEYISSSIENWIENDMNAGKINIDWASFEEKDMTKCTFTFKAIKEGKVQFSVGIDGGFADDNMVIPTSYDVTTYGVTTVMLKASNSNTPTPTATTKPVATTTPSGNNTQNPTATAKPNEGQASTNISTPTPTAKAPTVLPKAGDGTNILVVIPVLLSMSIIAYMQIRKYKDV